VIVRRRVSWGECDPAKVVYTPRFADYLVAAYGWFTRVELPDALVLDDGTRLTTPIKALSLEFHHVLRPEDLFDMTVAVLSVRTRTFDLLVSGSSPDGNPHFTGRLSPIVVDSANFRSVAIPPRARSALLAYEQVFPRRSDPRSMSSF
jgi:acyl-CoA thioesterase FadM